MSFNIISLLTSLSDGDVNVVCVVFDVLSKYIRRCFLCKINRIDVIKSKSIKNQSFINFVCSRSCEHSNIWFRRQIILCMISLETVMTLIKLFGADVVPVIYWQTKFMETSCFRQKHINRNNICIALSQSCFYFHICNTSA